MSVYGELERIWKEGVVAYLNAVSEHLRGGIDENSEKSESGYPVPEPKIKPETSQYGSANRSAATPNRVV
jgi:hypothetical protein